MTASFPFQILSTFKVQNNQILFRDLHLERIQKTIHFLKIQYGFKLPIDLNVAIQQQFQQIEKNHQQPTKVRLVIHLNPIKYEISIESLVENLSLIRLRFCQFGKQKSGLGIGNYKTTDRKFWDQNNQLIQSPNEDVIGINDKDEVTETSRFSIFVQIGDALVTPPLESGCLAGVFREHALRQKYVDLNGRRFGVSEKTILKNDISKYSVFVGNSVRGLLRAEVFENEMG